jgi:two-component system, OmpR family, sensor histidine kinase BaeS
VRYDLRPLDPVRSIKGKLGTLVAVTVAVASVLAVVGIRLGLSGWAVVVLAVGAALAVTQVLARGMTSPLREMTVAAQHMARGDYSRRVRATSGDEVGELAVAFNRMAATLEAVDHQRRDLVANVSHELRTPISALQAVLENLVDGVSEPDPETLRTALAQTERLGRLVADLLDLSRIEEGVTPLRVKDVPLGEFLSEAVSQARVDGLRYAVRVEPAGLTVPADPERLHQLVANLVDNASRHSPKGGEVRVLARVAGTHVRIDVADDGPGIAPADRGAVFERFTTSSAHDSGTGLGLAISRWVAQLHGGTIEVADADRGCVLRVQLPLDPTTVHQEATTMSTLTPPAPLPAAPPPPHSFGLGTVWPDAGRGNPALVVAAVVVGALAALVLPDHDLGIGTALVFAAVVVVVAVAASWRDREPLDAVDAVLVALLLTTLVLRDAEWITVLCLLAALALVAVNSTRARTFVGILATGAAVPLATLRGLPWLGRSLRRTSGDTRWVAIVRTTVVSVVLLLVFGALFSSADAVFARWVDAVTPDVTWNDLPARVVLGGFIATGTLAAAFVALAPPALDRLALPRRTSHKRFEWLAPVVVVDVVFAAFLAAQAAALFGGHTYLRETTGLTYAEYVHEGFGQLTVATVLTLTVIGWASRKAEAGRARDVALGALGVMTLVVVVSALHRMHVYEEAYGFTRLRLLVSVFEAWLGVVVLLVLVTGLVGGRWLVTAAVRLGAAGLLGLALVNPDLYIVEHNLSRSTETVPVDYAYLGGLSADAWPALAKLSDREFACATQDTERVAEDDWVEWNLARSRARDLQVDRPPVRSVPSAPTDCGAVGR